ncbi:MAG: DUF2953 domain-containing protein [Peptococcaceae bacterium]|nr:DUF2953 domain-containing protein [Peptococcaceae bacterium]
MHGLALLCAVMLWILVGFFYRWKIRLRITAENDHVSVKVGCGPTKAGAVFQVSSASFQGIVSDVKAVVAGMKAESANPEKRGKRAKAKRKKEEKAGEHKAIKSKGRIIRNIHVLWARISVLLALRRRVKRLLFALTRKMEVQALRVSVEGGVGDAAQTSLISGALWMVWGMLIAHLYKRVRVTGEEIGLRVSPDFEEVGVKIDVLSIVKLKTSHIIVKSVQMILWFRRAKHMLE